MSSITTDYLCSTLRNGKTGVHRIHLLPKKMTHRMCQVSLVVMYNIVLKYFADIRFGMFLSNLIDKNRIYLEMKILQCTQSDVVVNFNDVIRIAHCALNIESTHPVAILTFECT